MKRSPRNVDRSFAHKRFRRVFMEQLEDRSLLAAMITVNSALDIDARDSMLTLREAIMISNRTLAVGNLTSGEAAQVSGAPTSSDSDTIGFNISSSDPRHVYYADNN